MALENNNIADVIDSIEENSSIDTESLERDYNSAKYLLDSYGLSWTFRSIKYVLDAENTSFGQLRSCVYKVDGEFVFDYIKSTLILIKAGLVGSKQIHESKIEELNNRAYDILEDWRSKVGFIGLLHILIIDVMESKHFFIGDPEMGVIQHITSKGLQRDLGLNILREDMEERIRQLQALGSQN